MLTFYKGGAGISSAGTAEFAYQSRRTKQAWQAQATFAGAGSFSASIRMRLDADATFADIGSFSALANLRMVAAATFAGAGNFSANPLIFVPASATLAGASNFTLDAIDLRPLFPDADLIDGSWTDQSGGTNLFPAIDEVVADDADYIRSAITPSSDICKISFGDPDTGVAQPFIVSYRYGKIGQTTVDLTVRLLEGTTQIASWTHANVSSGFVTAEQTLSGTQFSAISDFNNLFIEFNANAP